MKQTVWCIVSVVQFIFGWYLDDIVRFCKRRSKQTPLDDSCSECGGTDKSWIDGKRCRTCAGEKQEARADLSELKRESFRAFWARWEETHGGADAWMDCPACDGSGLDYLWCGDCRNCSIPGVIDGGSGRVLKSSLMVALENQGR